MNHSETPRAVHCLYIYYRISIFHTYMIILKYAYVERALGTLSTDFWVKGMLTKRGAVFRNGTGAHQPGSFLQCGAWAPHTEALVWALRMCTAARCPTFKAPESLFLVP